VVPARSESGSSYETRAFNPEEMMVMLKELDSPETQLEWARALHHGATGLRREEAFGVKGAISIGCRDRSTSGVAGQLTAKAKLLKAININTGAE